MWILWSERKIMIGKADNSRINTKFPLTNRIKTYIIVFPYGSAMVSTGELKYDKRSAPDNRVKMSKLKQ